MRPGLVCSHDAHVHAPRDKLRHVPALSLECVPVHLVGRSQVDKMSVGELEKAIGGVGVQDEDLWDDEVSSDEEDDD